MQVADSTLTCQTLLFVWLQHKQKRSSKESKKHKHSKSKKARKEKADKHKRRKPEAAPEHAEHRFGIIRESDMAAKRSEFMLWAMDEKKADVEALQKWEEKELWKDYVDEYNTESLPHRRYYDLQAYERCGRGVSAFTAVYVCSMCSCCAMSICCTAAM